MSLFNFMDMIDNYEERKVANFVKEKLVIDTCAVNDSSKPFETAVSHPQYNDGKWVIVELYDTRKDAEAGHDKWVRKLTHELPATLTDVSTAEVAQLADAFGDGAWRKKEKK